MTSSNETKDKKPSKKPNHVGSLKDLLHNKGEKGRVHNISNTTDKSVLKSAIVSKGNNSKIKKILKNLSKKSSVAIKKQVQEYNDKGMPILIDDDEASKIISEESHSINNRINLNLKDNAAVYRGKSGSLELIEMKDGIDIKVQGKFSGVCSIPRRDLSGDIIKDKNGKTIYDTVIIENGNVVALFHSQKDSEEAIRKKFKEQYMAYVISKKREINEEIRQFNIEQMIEGEVVQEENILSSILDNIHIPIPPPSPPPPIRSRPIDVNRIFRSGVGEINQGNANVEFSNILQSAKKDNNEEVSASDILAAIKDHKKNIKQSQIKVKKTESMNSEYIDAIKIARDRIPEGELDPKDILEALKENRNKYNSLDVEAQKTQEKSIGKGNVISEYVEAIKLARSQVAEGELSPEDILEAIKINKEKNKSVAQEKQLEIDRALKKGITTTLDREISNSQKNLEEQQKINIYHKNAKEQKEKYAEKLDDPNVKTIGDIIVEWNQEETQKISPEEKAKEEAKSAIDGLKSLKLDEGKTKTNNLPNKQSHDKGIGI